ncbi:MAG: DNA polymerase III subunit beta [Phycisphaeraceae bacterium]
MKVICDRAALVEALNLVSGVVVSRTPKPVLTCVKLAAADGTLTVQATDLEAAIRFSTARVDIQEPGEVLVPADKISQIVRESLDPTLTIETDGNETHIRGQDSHFKMYGYPVGDFPNVPEFTGDADFEVSAGQLSQLVHQTIYATARENSRYAINGVLLERDGNKLTVVATDGHRLAQARGECKGDKKTTKSAIVPTRALQQLLKLLSDAEEIVRVKIADNQILFATDYALLASNLVEGNFPPYKDVVPKDGDKKATIDTGALTSAVRRASLLTNEESKGVKLAFSKGKLKLTSRAPELGEAEIDVDLPGYEGDPIEIGFNPFYLLDALKVIPTEQVQIDMKASNKPGVVRTGQNFLYVVMPVNLQ